MCLRSLLLSGNDFHFQRFLPHFQPNISPLQQQNTQIWRKYCAADCAWLTCAHHVVNLQNDQYKSELVARLLALALPAFGHNSTI